jgi:hypothetical protein
LRLRAGWEDKVGRKEKHWDQIKKVKRDIYGNVSLKILAPPYSF